MWNTNRQVVPDKKSSLILAAEALKIPARPHSLWGQNPKVTLKHESVPEYVTKHNLEQHVAWEEGINQQLPSFDPLFNSRLQDLLNKDKQDIIYLEEKNVL